MRTAADRLARGVKVCSKCSRERALEDFETDARRMGGRRANYLECD
jgi:hypothetical protein